MRADEGDDVSCVESDAASAQICPKLFQVLEAFSNNREDSLLQVILAAWRAKAVDVRVRASLVNDRLLKAQSKCRYAVGSRCEFLAPSSRTVEGSAVRLQPGQVVRVLELAEGKSKARIQMAATEGWTPLFTKDGKPRFAPVYTDAPSQAKAPANLKLAFLEAARAGNVPVLREVLLLAESLPAARRTSTDSGGSGSGGVASPIRSACLNARDSEERTPLMYAVAHCRLSAIRFLLSYGEVDVNAIDEAHLTALHYVCKQPKASGVDYDSICTLLLEAGARACRSDCYGFTPMAFAAARGHAAVVKRLMQAMGSATQLDSCGITPYQYAEHYGHSDVLELLVRTPSMCKVPHRDRQGDATGTRGAPEVKVYALDDVSLALDSPPNDYVENDLPKRARSAAAARSQKRSPHAKGKGPPPREAPVQKAVAPDADARRRLKCIGLAGGMDEKDLEFLDMTSGQYLHASEKEGRRAARQSARRLLRLAHANGDESDLKAAIAAARFAGVSSGVVDAYAKVHADSASVDPGVKPGASPRERRRRR